MNKFILITLILSVLTCGCSKTMEVKSLEPEIANTEQVKEINPIDKALQECLDKNDTTVGMNKCVYQSMESWNKEIEKYLDLLSKIITEDDYNKILEAQTKWIEFKELEFETINLVMEKQGTMFQNSTVGLKAALIKERALNLKELYDTLSYEN